VRKVNEVSYSSIGRFYAPEIAGMTFSAIRQAQLPVFQADVHNFGKAGTLGASRIQD
jgi:hypothetical protein